MDVIQVEPFSLITEQYNQQPTANSDNKYNAHGA